MNGRCLVTAIMEAGLGLNTTADTYKYNFILIQMAGSLLALSSDIAYIVSPYAGLYASYMQTIVYK